MERDSRPEELTDGVRRLARESAERLTAKTTPTPEQLQKRREGALRHEAQKAGLIPVKGNVQIDGTRLWRVQDMNGDVLVEGLTLEEVERFVRERAL